MSRSTAYPSGSLSLPVQDWPAEDRRVWNASFDEDELFSDAGRGLRLRPKTRAKYAYGYGRWLAALKAIDASALGETAARRCTRDRLVAYCELLSKNCKPSAIVSYLGDLAHALQFVAPEADVAQIRDLARRHLQRAPTSEPLGVPTSDRLFQLGLDLIGAGRSAAKLDMRSARTYRDGLLIVILAVAPMRRSNYIGLTLCEHLQRNGDEYSILIPAAEAKGKRELDYVLPPLLTPMIDHYLQIVRPFLLKGRRTDHLWISERSRPFSSDAFYVMICKRTYAAFGRPVSPHRFREAAASTIGRYAPEQVNAARDLLGHAKLATTHRHYLRANGIQAARTFAGIIGKRRGGEATDGS